MRNLTIIFLICISNYSFISCNKEKSERELKVVQINNKSDDIFNTAKLLANDSGFIVNIDSVTKEYEKIKIDSAELGLQYATKFKDYTMELQYKKIDKEIAEDKISQKESNIVNRNWENSKAGRIQKKHPNWSKEDCISISENKYWIGMTYDMLIYSRGKPNSVNPSDYGNGVEYQCCWDDYKPSCFYMKEDNIIISYN